VTMTDSWERAERQAPQRELADQLKGVSCAGPD
jgi:hypothetical protein